VGLPWKVKSWRHHTSYGEFLSSKTGDPDLGSQNILLSAKTALPERIAQHGDGCASFAIFFRKKRTPQKRSGSQDREVVGGHVSGSHTFRTIVIDDFYGASTRPIRREGELCEGPRTVAPIGKITWRNEFLIESLRGVPFPKDYDTIRI